MNLMDPFNRVSCRQEKEYQAVQQQLRDAGVDSEEKAILLLRKSRSQMLNLCLLLIAVIVAVQMFWPQWFAMAVVFGVLFMVWLVVTMVRGQRMIQQYIKQEFSTGERYEQ